MGPLILPNQLQGQPPHRVATTIRFGFATKNVSPAGGLANRRIDGAACDGNRKPFVSTAPSRVACARMRRMRMEKRVLTTQPFGFATRPRTIVRGSVSEWHNAAGISGNKNQSARTGVHKRVTS